MKLFIDKADDIEAVAVILIRNGYTVRQAKKKDGTKVVRWLEVERDGDKQSQASSD